MPISWRLFKKRPASVMHEFAVTEEDSGWQFAEAMPLLDDPAHRALLFHNALEEHEHAHRFLSIAIKLPGGAEPRPVVARSFLIDDTHDLAEFLAYVYAGELDISKEFNSYAAAIGRDDVSHLFAEISEEEAGHHSTLKGALLAIAGSEETITGLVKKARRRRLWRAWLKVSKSIGDTFLGLWLVVIYLVFGPLLFWASRSRLRGA